MGNWGVSDTAEPKEKLKAEMADYLHGLNATGGVHYSVYSDIFDFSMELLNRMYDLASQPTIPHTMHNGDISPSCATCGLVESLTEKLEGRTAKKHHTWPEKQQLAQCGGCAALVGDTFKYCPNCGRKFVDVSKAESTTGEGE